MVVVGDGKACRIEMLGRLQVRMGSQLLDHFPTQKTAGLLAYLANSRGDKVTRETLVTLLWPGVESVSGRNRLNQAVSSLRKIVPDGVLGSDSKSIWLDMGLVETDVEEFENLSAEQVVQQNGSLYRGPFLDGMNDSWAVRRRIELSNTYTAHLLHALRLAVSAGDANRSLAEAQRLLNHDEAQVEAHGVTIKAYVDLGRLDAARQAYAHMQAVLPPEIADQTQSLAMITHAERMEAVGRTDPYVAFRPKLPRFNDPIIGRDAEIDAIVEKFDSGVRAVGVTGLPGIGKTRVAVATGNRVAARFEGRVAYINCDLARSKNDLRREAVRALTDGASSDAREFDDLVVRLNPARPFLMILDHAERVPEREEAMRQLLFFIPGLITIVVSRAPIPDLAESCVEVGPLPQADAMTLFRRRYTSNRPEYEFTASDEPAIEAIVRSTGGQAVALEALASRARILTPTQMQELLAAPSDQEEILAPSGVLASSVQELPDDFRQVVYRLALITGPMSLETVRNLNPDLSLDQIADLERMGWIQCILEGSNDATYVMPTVFREELTRTMTPHQMQRARKDIVRYCFEVAANSDAETYSDQFFGAVRRVYGNRGIIQDTLRYLVESQRGRQMAELAARLGLYWRHVAEPQEGITTLLELIDHAEQNSVDAESLAQLRLILGGIYRIVGEVSPAKQQYDLAWQHYQGSGDTTNTLRCLFGLAAYAHEFRSYAEERDILNQARELAQEKHLVVFEAFAHHRMGSTFVTLEESELARQHYLRALILSQEAGAESYEAAALDAISSLDLRLGKFERATTQLVASLAIQEQNHDYFGMVDNKIYLARARIGLGELDRAKILLREIFDGNEAGHNLRDSFVAVTTHYCVAAQKWVEAARLLGFLDRSSISGRHLNVLIADDIDRIQAEVAAKIPAKYESEVAHGQILRPRDLGQLFAEILAQD